MTEARARLARPDGCARALAAPRDIAALAAFRVAFGAIVAISALRFLAYGWIDELFVQRRGSTSSTGASAGCRRRRRR